MSIFLIVLTHLGAASFAQTPLVVPAEPVANPGITAPLQYVNPSIQQLNNNLMTTQPTPAYSASPVSTSLPPQQAQQATP